MRQAEFWCHLVAVAPEKPKIVLSRRDEIHVKVKRELGLNFIEETVEDYPFKKCGSELEKTFQRELGQGKLLR